MLWPKPTLKVRLQPADRNFMDDIRRVDETERSQWDAYGDALRDMVAARGSDEEAAAIAAVTQAGKNLDPESFRDALHIPKDAGEYEAVLESMLKRIPAGWGRWVSCDKGWYPLIAKLDEQIRQINEHYEIHQLKEKFGTLRFYWGMGEIPIEGQDFVVGSPDYYEWTTTKEGSVYAEGLNALSQAISALVDTAEAASATICEVCGQPGELRRTKSAGAWVKTVCDEHAKADPDNERSQEYLTSDEWNAWWAIEQPRHAQRQRDYVRNQWADKRAVIIGDSDVELVFDTERITDEDAARAAAGVAYDGVFIGAGPAGEAFVDALVKRYADHAQSIVEGLAAARAAGKGYSYPRPEGAPSVHLLEGADGELFKRMSALGMTSMRVSASYVQPSDDQ